ncbi:hypothetical protein PsorP6_010377 [Peronosclerospora sorghi]|uniref:Uncharacterized protein n=1 Tax=Peronosclerospora sorghi TaxID=230839 RepID=A0ACC0VW34_9STRA|nr:hypothetical protein PsorP6_019434 [Peronosclerospora sorghi]KAI9909931.1 hypothetical protein PsorP6_010377 [Peronosclerospora sorghi]
MNVTYTRPWKKYTWKFPSAVCLYAWEMNVPYEFSLTVRVQVMYMMSAMYIMYQPVHHHPLPSRPSPSHPRMATTRPRSVVLHLDLNRTVLMSDAAGGRTLEDTVNYLLSECTWGYVHPSHPSKWHCVSDVASMAPPVLAPRATLATRLITYKQFVDDAYPYQTIADALDDESDRERIHAHNRAAKAQRTALQSAFVTGPGARVRACFDTVLAQLQFPSGTQRERAKTLASTLPSRSRLHQAWRDGRYYLLPSFVHFLASLASSEQDVKLVFRTFGDDLADVATELALLVDGTHPTGLPALPERFRLALTPSRIGTFHRDGLGPDGTVLVLGTLDNVPLSARTTCTNAAVQVIRGFPSIHEVLEHMLERASTLALRDDWAWWSAHAEASECGKLLLVDEDATAAGHVRVFLDDHIETHAAHIVDVRDVRSGRPVPFPTARDTYLQRVEPLAAITDINYFTSLFHKHVHT